jgi:hypothetical protein
MDLANMRDSDVGSLDVQRMLAMLLFLKDMRRPAEPG